jgi:hypothetical protein
MPACCERSARTAGESKCSKALNCVPVGGAEVGAKNETFFSGRVPHVRPSVHGLKTDSSNAFTLLHEDLALGRSLFANVIEAMEGAAPFFFGPCTPGRTRGTGPGRRASLMVQPHGHSTATASRPQVL